jgi:phospholipase/lecithinase/hemolysin
LIKRVIYEKIWRFLAGESVFPCGGITDPNQRKDISLFGVGMKKIQRSLAAVVRSFALIACLCFLGTLLEGAPFARMVSFGDSLADTGNIRRASNGPVWPEYLAGYLNVDLEDYAHSGAKTGDIESPLGFLGQVDLFLEDAAVDGVGDRDLFTAVIGGNDFIDHFTGGGSSPIPGSIDNTVAGVKRLLKAGARNLVVWMVPDLSITPATSNLSPEQKEGVSNLTGLYNAELEVVLEDLASGFDCRLVVVDINLAFYDMIAYPEDYGLDNVFFPAEDSEWDPATSLFWDLIHPTTVAHQLLADFVLSSLEIAGLVTLVDPLIGGIPYDEEGWFESDWFGTYYTAYAPWIWHAEHGFIYRDPASSNESMFVYDDAMGVWWWTSETVYPFIFAFNPPADNVGTDVESCWLFYFEGGKTPRILGVATGADEGSFLFFGP